MILKNVAGQGVYLYAHNKAADTAAEGDAANIYGFITKDGGAAAAFETISVSEIASGLYWQPLSQGETNANMLAMAWFSSTADVYIDPLIVSVDSLLSEIHGPKVIFVDNVNGNDSNNGNSWTNAKATFTSAISAATDYTTIKLSPGVHAISGTPKRWTTTLRIEGAGRNSTFISGATTLQPGGKTEFAHLTCCTIHADADLGLTWDRLVLQDCNIVSGHALLHGLHLQGTSAAGLHAVLINCEINTDQIGVENLCANSNVILIDTIIRARANGLNVHANNTSITMLGGRIENKLTSVPGSAYAADAYGTNSSVTLISVDLNKTVISDSGSLIGSIRYIGCNFDTDQLISTGQIDRIAQSVDRSTAAKSSDLTIANAALVTIDGNLDAIGSLLLATDGKVNTISSTVMETYTAVDVVDSVIDGVDTKTDTILAALAGTGAGSVPVDHNYGGADNLAYRTVTNISVDNAEIWCYRKVDYDADLRSTAYVVARATTDVNGRWVAPMMLDPSTYTLVYFKQGQYGPDVREVTVTA